MCADGRGSPRNRWRWLSTNWPARIIGGFEATTSQMVVWGPVVGAFALLCYREPAWSTVVAVGSRR